MSFIKSNYMRMKKMSNVFQKLLQMQKPSIRCHVTLKMVLKYNFSIEL